MKKKLIILLFAILFRKESFAIEITEIEDFSTIAGKPREEVTALTEKLLQEPYAEVYFKLKKDGYVLSAIFESLSDSEAVSHFPLRDFLSFPVLGNDFPAPEMTFHFIIPLSQFGNINKILPPLLLSLEGANNRPLLSSVPLKRIEEGASLPPKESLKEEVTMPVGQISSPPPPPPLPSHVLTSSRKKEEKQVSSGENSPEKLKASARSAERPFLEDIKNGNMKLKPLNTNTHANKPKEKPVNDMFVQLSEAMQKRRASIDG